MVKIGLRMRYPENICDECAKYDYCDRVYKDSGSYEYLSIDPTCEFGEIDELDEIDETEYVYPDSVIQKSIIARKAIIDLMHEVFKTNVPPEVDFKTDCSNLLTTLKMYRDGFKTPVIEGKTAVIVNGLPVKRFGKYAYQVIE